MKKIFLRDNIKSGNQIILNFEESNHLMNALRYRLGDEIIVSDEIAQEYHTIIKEFSGGQVLLEIKRTSLISENNLKITLIQGLCKGEKMDFIVQKATELGVCEIIPLETMRTIVKLDNKKAEKRVERWQKIALEAAKQCGTSVVPQIRNIIKLTEYAKEMTGRENYLLFWEEEKDRKLKETLDSIKGNKLKLIIGPEGGFDEKEVVVLRENGALPVSLGERILRTETAGIGAISCVMYHYGDLG